MSGPTLGQKEPNSRRCFCFHAPSGAYRIRCVLHRVHKRRPLRISRGISAHSDNFFVALDCTDACEKSEAPEPLAPEPEEFALSGRSAESMRFVASESSASACGLGLRTLGPCTLGLGEMGLGVGQEDLSAQAAAMLGEFLADRAWDCIEPFPSYDRAMASGMHPAVYAALDMAMWDLLAKRARMPLFRMLGFGRPTAHTSVTVGIVEPREGAALAEALLAESGARQLKLKLGSVQGCDHDEALLAAVAEVATAARAGLRVDANGGWSVAEAKRMLARLHRAGVAYVEQPLDPADDAALPELFADRPLPIFVDESCQLPADVVRLHGCVDGVNLKLMKCGGISGALRLIMAAKAARLQCMVGCMSESSIAISAAAALTGELDHVDLDAHLNLRDDPAEGAAIEQGVLQPAERPGHGARLWDPRSMNKVATRGDDGEDWSLGERLLA